MGGRDPHCVWNLPCLQLFHSCNRWGWRESQFKCTDTEGLFESSVSGGRVWPWQEKGPSLSFSLPTSTRFTRFVQYPTGTVPWRGKLVLGNCRSPQSTRMGPTGRTKSLSSNCCFRSLLIWICKFLQHRQRWCISASCVPLMPAGLLAASSFSTPITPWLWFIYFMAVLGEPKQDQSPVGRHYANSMQGRSAPRELPLEMGKTQLWLRKGQYVTATAQGQMHAAHWDTKNVCQHSYGTGVLEQQCCIRTWEGLCWTRESQHQQPLSWWEIPLGHVLHLVAMGCADQGAVLQETEQL